MSLSIRELNFVVLATPGVNKTAFIERVGQAVSFSKHDILTKQQGLLHKDQRERATTTEDCSCSKVIRSSCDLYPIYVTDLANTECHGHVWGKAIQSADSCIIVYDITKDASLDFVNGKFLRHLQLRGPTTPKKVVVLVGIDPGVCEDKRSVYVAEGQNLARRHGWLHSIVPNTEGYIACEKVFLNVAKHLHYQQRRGRGSRSTAVSGRGVRQTPVDTARKQSRTCCIVQ